MKLTEEVLEGAPPSSVINLALPNKKLQEISFLKAFKNLVRLDVSHNHLQSMEALSNCRSLKWLSVASNDLRSLAGIETLFNLLVLNCSCNKLTSIGEVEGLFGLRALIVNDNEIKTLCKLQKLTALNALVLSKNPISGFEVALEGVPSLNKLSLSHCQLQELGSIKQLIELKELRLAHNNLKYLSKELAKNSKLQIIDLGSNFFKNLSDIEVLSNLPYLRNLNVRGNPLCIQAGYEEKLWTLLPALQVLDGHSLRGASKKKASDHQSVLSIAVKQLKAGKMEDLQSSDKIIEAQKVDKVFETGIDQRGQASEEGFHRIKKPQNAEKKSKEKLVKAVKIQEAEKSEDSSHRVRKRQKKEPKDNSVQAILAREGQTSEDRQRKLEKRKKRRQFEASMDEDLSMQEIRKGCDDTASDDNDSKSFIELIVQKRADRQGSKECPRPTHGLKKEDTGLVSIIHNQSKVAKQKKNKQIAKASSAFSTFMGGAEVGGGGQSSWN